MRLLLFFMFMSLLALGIVVPVEGASAKGMKSITKRLRKLLRDNVIRDDIKWSGYLCQFLRKNCRTRLRSSKTAMLKLVESDEPVELTALCAALETLDLAATDEATRRGKLREARAVRKDKKRLGEVRRAQLDNNRRGSARIQKRPR